MTTKCGKYSDIELCYCSGEQCRKCAWGGWQIKTNNTQNNTAYNNSTSVSDYESDYDNRDSHDKMNDYYKECYDRGTGAHEDCEM